MMKEIKEWNINTRWGKLAMISWGHSSHPPMLMVHGYMDNAATFSFLAEYIDEYYCVAFDMPGHGKSDPFPPGPHITQAHMVDIIRRIVDHMEWKTFVLVAHSMGVMIGAVYNTIYPGEVSHMVCMDPGPPITLYYEHYYELSDWYARYDSYYQNNYGRLAASNPTLHKYDDIVKMTAEKRKLSKQQAEVVLSRSLVPAGDGMYRLSWEPRARTIVSLAISEDILLRINFTNTPPLLITVSSEDDNRVKAKHYGERMVKNYYPLKNCSVINVNGHHDVHITKAKTIAEYINEFLIKKNCDRNSKL